MDPSFQSRFKQRSVIEFLVAEGCAPIDIHRRLLNVYGGETIDVCNVRRWVLRAQSCERGLLDVNDSPRSGRPVTVTTDEMQSRVDALIQENRRIKQHEIANILGISKDRVCFMVKNLGYRKLCARWVPKMLTLENKAARVEVCRALLRRYDQEGDEFLSQIATGDESWIHHYDPEEKRQSMEYRRKGSPPPRKFKTVASAGKIMLTLFWDSEGALLTEYLPRGETVNSDKYCGTLQRLKSRIRRIRPARTKFLLQHDNARPHCSRQTSAKIERLNFDTIPHPPYSPDLAPCDFWVFPNLKRHLKGTHFSSDAEVKAAVARWIQSQPHAFFFDGIQQLVERWRKCVELNGDYIEK